MNTNQNLNLKTVKKGITFLIPALNEEESIEYTINLCKQFSKKNSEIPYEILVSDNDSKDNTVSIAKKMGCNVVTETKKGYGANIINGIKNSKYEYIIFGDADGSYDFSDGRKFYDLLEDGFDLVMGNRFSNNKNYKMEKKSMPFLHKYFGNPILSFIARFMFQINITDFHCGLRAINKKSFKNGNIFLCKGMEFATEVVAIASKLRLKVAEVPIKLYVDKRKYTLPHLNTWRDGWRHLKFILTMSHTKIFTNLAIFLLLINLSFHLFYFLREFFELEILTNLNLVTSLFLNALSHVGLNLLILNIFLSKTVKTNYKIDFVENEILQSTLTKVSSDTYFKLAGIVLLILSYTSYFIFNTWLESKFTFLDLRSDILIYHIIVFSQLVPILLFFIKMGFINYIVLK